MFQVYLHHLLLAWKSVVGFKMRYSLFNVLNKTYKKRKKAVAEKESRVHLFGFDIIGTDAEMLYYLVKEIFTGKEYDFLTASSAPVILDCGSNIGLSIIYFKMKYPKSRIIGFEASPFIFKILSQNVNKNKLSDVSLFNVALFNTETELPFYVHDEKPQIASLKSMDESGKKVFVKTAFLSGFIKREGTVDLVKMDIEGAEWEVVQELDEAGVLQMVNQYLIEYHLTENAESYRLSSFLNIFERNGFRYRIKGAYHKRQKEQGILINFYK
jgi:FkbM family methyltransferase